MHVSDALDVITAAALVDNRTIGEAAARMWAEILPDWIRPADAVAAVALHYQQSREFVMPADIIEKARTVRTDRVRAAGEPQYPEGIAGAERWAWRDAWMRALFAGELVSGAEDFADVTVGRDPRHRSVVQLESRRAEIARYNPPRNVGSPDSAADDGRW